MGHQKIYIIIFPEVKNYTWTISFFYIYCHIGVKKTFWKFLFLEHLNMTSHHIKAVQQIWLTCWLMRFYIYDTFVRPYPDCCLFQKGWHLITSESRTINTCPNSAQTFQIVHTARQQMKRNKNYRIYYIHGKRFLTHFLSFLLGMS